MLQDILLLVTSDRNKPFLGYFVKGIVRLLELQPRNPALVSTAIQILNQLMFEPSISNEFLESKSRLLSAFKSIGPLRNPTDARNLSLLHRVVDDLRDPQEEGQTEEKSSLPEYPTHVLVICPAEHAQDGMFLVERLQKVGYAPYFCCCCCGDPIEPHAIMEAYFGVVLLTLASEPTINQL